MKNLLTVIAFVASVFIGSETTFAQSLSQNENRPEVIAKAETANLSENLGLDGSQTRAVFRALVAKEVGYQKNINNKDLNQASVKADKQKIDSELDATMKKILTENQYNKWRNE